LHDHQERKMPLSMIILSTSAAPRESSRLLGPRASRDPRVLGDLAPGVSY
jgi:hypothetical protein